jgi:hypothetical protein
VTAIEPVQSRLDPDSPRGREVAEGLAGVLAEVRARLAREAAAGAGRESA